MSVKRVFNEAVRAIVKAKHLWWVVRDTPVRWIIKLDGTQAIQYDSDPMPEKAWKVFTFRDYFHFKSYFEGYREDYVFDKAKDALVDHLSTACIEVANSEWNLLMEDHVAICNQLNEARTKHQHRRGELTFQQKTEYYMNIESYLMALLGDEESIKAALNKVKQ